VAGRSGPPEEDVRRRLHELLALDDPLGPFRRIRWRRGGIRAAAGKVSPESLLAQLRATVGRRKTPPTAKPIVVLSNTVCYSGDIRRPLGINRMLPEDTVVEVADNRLERRYNGSGWPIQRRFAPSGPLQTMSPPPASAWPSPGRQRRAAATTHNRHAERQAPCSPRRASSTPTGVGPRMKRSTGA